VKTYAVGDIHGMKSSLDSALGFIANDSGGEAHTVVFLGDYVDRGPDSAGVVRLLMAGPTLSAAKWVCLKGNHDDMMGQELLGLEHMDWIHNYGRITLKSYVNDEFSDAEYRHNPELKKHCSWLLALRRYYDDGVRYFCHAGINPQDPLDQQNPNVLIWDRDWYQFHWGQVYDVKRLVVHGHTPTLIGASQMPVIDRVDGEPRSINLDTGACWPKEGGKLTVAVWDNEHSRDFRTVQF